MKCDKEAYTKTHARIVRETIYKKSGRKKRLRIYLCNLCYYYHLTSTIEDL